MEVSIIIPTKNGEKTIAKCLESVFSQKFEGDFEVIVIDSGSTDGTLEIVKRYPARLVKIQPNEFGHGSTRNLGATLASGELLAYINQDAVPCNERWLHNLTRRFKEDLNLAAVYGRQICNGRVNPINRFRMDWLYGNDLIVKKLNDSSRYERKLFAFSTANAAIRHNILRKYPFGQEMYFAEDTAFAKNILFGRYTIIYEPEAVVWHGHNYSPLQIFSRYFDMGISYRRSGILDLIKGGVHEEGGSYVLNELRYLVKNKHILWIPHSVMHNTAKYMGFQMGCYEKFIPRRLKNKISKYW